MFYQNGTEEMRGVIYKEPVVVGELLMIFEVVLQVGRQMAT